MDRINEFDAKVNKYMPIFPKATGQPTYYIEGYPFEDDDEPMAATDYHAIQINLFFDQLYRLYRSEPYIHIGLDSFIYYSVKGTGRNVLLPMYMWFWVQKKRH